MEGAVVISIWSSFLRCVRFGADRDRSHPRTPGNCSLVSSWLPARRDAKLDGPRSAVPDARARLGFSQAAQTSSLYESPESHYSFYRSYRSLFPAQYWSLYKQSPDVRACVDSIVRRIATWDWFVKPTVDPRNADEYRRMSEVCDEVAAAFVEWAGEA